MNDKKFYIETYGCQMNEADSELVAGILEKISYREVKSPEEADVVLVNSCSVREKAEDRVLSRLSQLKSLKKENESLLLGIIGCSAENKKDEIVANYPFIDIILGPDSYRKIPQLLKKVRKPIIDVHLSKTEVYSNLIPKRRSDNSAWISIMRGCNKFCAYCIVPYTRGRERSRSIQSIMLETEKVVKQGVKEIILLGQNVNSYNYDHIRFPQLLKEIAKTSSLKRIRFMSPHPQDITENLLEVMSEYPSICNHIHLPLQAGSSRVLNLMNRNYTKEHFLNISRKIKEYLPDSAITTDIIVGFPGENEVDFRYTLDVMDQVMFDSAFMFKYSPRPGTKAAKMNDDVRESEKAARLNRVIEKQQEHTLQRNKQQIDTIQEVYIEGCSKKNPDEKIGRTGTNKIVIIKRGKANIGDFINVKIEDTAGVSLFGKTI